jgi:hypothetical protein
MALSGDPTGAPRPAPGPVAARAEAAVAALAAEAGSRALETVDGAALLGERAAILGLGRRGPISPGGSCRFVRCADGWIAVNLPRGEDRRSLPAWLGAGDAADPWSFVAARAARRSAAELVARARLLGLAVAPLGGPREPRRPWLRVARYGACVDRRAGARPFVVDLSGLWAGPLCTHLLALAGARVVKVESTRRPDGARFGPGAFFDLLHAGKASVALDFAAESDRVALRRLLERADIVVESARPRALRQLGIEAEALVAARPGLSWVAITGYGRGAPQQDWVAFGDDAAAAAGLVLSRQPGPPRFCGDAVADPLAGIHGALAAYRAFRSGGGVLLDLSLRDVAAQAAAPKTPADGARVVHADGWELHVDGERHGVSEPRARVARGRARRLGADTRSVLAEPTRC